MTWRALVFGRTAPSVAHTCLPRCLNFAGPRRHEAGERIALTTTTVTAAAAAAALFPTLGR